MDNNTQNNADLDLQMMREQLMLLQEKLDERICFEESMLRKAMKKNVAQLLQWEWMVLFLCILVFFMTVSEVRQMHLGDGMQIFTVLFLGVMICVQIWSVWFVARKQKDVISGNLLRASQRIVVYKRADRWCKRIFIPVVLVWVICYLNEAVAHSPLATASAAYKVGVYVGGIIGAFVGGCFGWLIYRRMISQVNELEQQIKEIKRD